MIVTIPPGGMVEILSTGSEYDPPDFIIEAHKNALEHVITNQYAPITVRRTSKK